MQQKYCISHGRLIGQQHPTIPFTLTVVKRKTPREPSLYPLSRSILEAKSDFGIINHIPCYLSAAWKALVFQLRYDIGGNGSSRPLGQQTGACGSRRSTRTSRDSLFKHTPRKREMNSGPNYGVSMRDPQRHDVHVSLLPLVKGLSLWRKELNFKCSNKRGGLGKHTHIIRHYMTNTGVEQMQWTARL